MPDTLPNFERIALNRVTFGARDTEIAAVQRDGWSVWVEEQLNPPVGDDATLDHYLRSLIVHIQYDAFDDKRLNYHNVAVNEDRPLNYLYAPHEQIWSTARKVPWSIAPAETNRMEFELISGIFMRNAHSHYQLREFMTDFWLNHFNVAKSKGTLVAVSAIAYDRDVIRPNVFGNFRQMLEAVASSAAMLWYLDNAGSTAALPNENYARELMELHTMGRDAYFGKNPGGEDVSAKGFTDEDIVQASRALSGWTVQFGQNGALPGTASYMQVTYPDNGKFIYNSTAHNTEAGRFLGFDLSTITDNNSSQGKKVLDLVAYHPATAPFICGKICQRIFGDTPPASVVLRAVNAWNVYRDSPDQIEHVLRAILLDGAEIGTGPCVKIRRPYERFIAMIRTTDTVVGPDFAWTWYFTDLNDSPFNWATPDGRPDTNEFWLSTYAHVTTWEYMKRISDTGGLTTSFRAQTPVEVLKSPTLLVEYWLARMIGTTLNDEAMAALIDLGAGLPPPASGDIDLYWETAFARHVIATIAAAPEFVLR